MTNAPPANTSGSSFDYSSLPASKRHQVQQEAEAIRRLLQKTANDIVQIGLRLQVARNALGPHHFQQWLQAEFHWSQSVASNFMQAARAFANLDCVPNFQPSALYILARHRVPEAARREAICLASSGMIITKRQAEQIVSKHSSGQRISLGRVSSLRRAMHRLLERIGTLEPQTARDLHAELSTLAAELSRAIERELSTVKSRTARGGGGNSASPAISIETAATLASKSAS